MILKTLGQPQATGPCSARPAERSIRLIRLRFVRNLFALLSPLALVDASEFLRVGTRILVRDADHVARSSPLRAATSANS